MQQYIYQIHLTR